MRIGQHLQRQQLFPLPVAVRTPRHVPLQLMGLFVGQLSIGPRHNPLVCKFTIHKSTSFQPQKVPQISTKGLLSAGPYRNSANCVLNFFVALKSVFLAVSSVVFSISPIVRSRSPW